MLFDEPDIDYSTSNFLYSHSFVQAARECDDWDEQALRVLLDRDTNSIIELPDGSIFVIGEKSTFTFESFVGDIVRQRALTVADETDPLGMSLYLGGAPIWDFHWVRSMPITFFHMWSPNFAALPESVNFMVRDNVPPPFDRCNVTLRTLRKRRFDEIGDFRTFLENRLLIKGERDAIMCARVGSFSISKNGREVNIALDTEDIGEHEFLALLCTIVDFGFLYLPIKEVVFS